MFQRVDGVLKIIAARCEGPRENRIRGVRPIRYPGLLLFVGNVATEQLDDAIEVADHLPDRHSLPLRGFASIKMTLVSHGMLQNDPDSPQRREHHGFSEGGRKNLANSGSGAGPP